MENYRVIEIKQSVFADNDQDANRLRQELKENKTFLLNLMSSPGSGKTTTLKQTISRMKNKYRMAVMEADIDSDVDAAAIADTGIRTIQLHTGGMCHLDADMTRQGLRSMGIQNVDIAILENVGNLVCPAEFDTGAVKNAMILSVPEGHDKPLKYPLIFQVCDALIINKIDVSQPRIKNDGLCFDITDEIVVDVNVAFLVIIHGIAFADLNFLNQAYQRGTV